MGRHRGARRGAPVRTGLLGVSAAVALGAIAVTSGLLPGGDTFTVGSAGSGAGGEQRVATQQAPSLTTQGGASVTPAGDPASRSTGTGTGSGSGTGNGKAATPAAPSTSATPAPKPTATEPTAKPSPKAPAPKPSHTARPTQAPTTEAPAPPATVRPLADRAAAAEAEVVRLVNVERAKVGCVAIRSDADLAALAGAFSADMAARNFFDHTDPDGLTPWARATRAGVSGLGAENIARGQVDAAAVMKSWMASDGHRANILNCDYKTLGVGVHFADGGPWWTQDFGY
ncbi:CAP domain-containing protein [Streptomyces showdoensis]|uniref:SCP-like extracellular n=1 Tax=Streptomyces showdoensis TaxID=68268 RepID=A0A2P2GWA6_STREW|nr:CAP domain-containing protein [Streptomyces showdoensis]KKZ75767.1 SCP-like extracellular [Streptomyces showdoensis]